MAEKKGNWIWDKLRGKKREDLDKLERELIKGGSFERRDFAGDPNQDKQYLIKTRNK